MTVGLSSSTETLRTVRRRLIVVTLGSSWTVRLRTETPERSRLSTPTRVPVSVRLRLSTLAPPRDSPDAPIRSEREEALDPELLELAPVPEPELLGLVEVWA